MSKVSSEEKLDLLISYILIVGVIASVLIEATGIYGYYYTHHDLSIVFKPEFTLQGTDFFAYSAQTVQALLSGKWTPISVLAFGLVLLLITPYVRVLASAIYFGLAKNIKYLFITLFVLVVLTASLILH
jgi:uncharacterized membrane protein